ncbi:DUF2520 domain-containing protein [Undibacterium sp. CY18W]|uniref:DUF2520 domain-containing protein n=1 Tax=Undibacterium hunanense TaxID=2762292 RepID=A0ABR6ZWL7_9BURK|nr:Rossmann-like and DUF2520 domain-containing protein [Undibacterium hunanense]MBC3920269.1 DUF2520 domain-containing protein [Undibacterium hunanense]
MKTLNVIGAGKVGTVLAKNFIERQVFSGQQVMNRSLPSSQAAVDWLGAGAAVDDLHHMQPADVTMLTVTDDQIVPLCAAMAEAGLLHAGSIVFHCSGAKASTELQAAIAAGAAVASVHPVRSFADGKAIASQFAGTICSVEGDAHALAVLLPALQAIGAQTVEISADSKLLYHAGSVFASNYLVTLMETALRSYQAAGIPAAVAQQMAAPLARQTLDNVFAMGTAKALTGPIARGDMQTVALQQKMVAAWDQAAGDLYQAFTPLTQAVAARRHSEK